MMCVSSEACFLLCLALHLSIKCVSEDMPHCVKDCAFREYILYVLGLWGTQRNLGAGEPGPLSLEDHQGIVVYKSSQGK